MKRAIFFAISALFLLSSCVSKKEFQGLQASYGELEEKLMAAESQLDRCNQQRANLRSQLDARDQEIQNLENKISLLERELQFQKENNTNLLERLSDLSVLSKTEAENLRKTLESLQEQDKYIKDLTEEMQRKDSVNLALVMNLKRSLSDINDEDIQIKVKKGVVYVSISDKLLFASGKDDINPRAVEVLGKVAKVIKDHDDIEVMIQGHTDDVPIKTECMKDNWDLSVKRATAVIRVLQWRYEVDPSRLTAAGRSEFIPKATNETAEGRQANRRTEIIITPKLDQFFSLLEAPEGMEAERND